MKCLCDSKVLIAGLCTSCPTDGAFVDNTTCSCNDPNKAWDAVKNLCLCKPTFYIDVYSCKTCVAGSTVKGD